MLGVLPPAYPSGVQDLSADPLYGSISLTSGFAPDPYVVDIASGGTDGTEQLPEGCVGYITADQPDFKLYYDRDTGGFPLTLFVDGPSDTALLVNAPDGNWHCNDDGGGPDGLQPAVTFDSPASGTYDIWVGELVSDVYNDAHLVITELEPVWGTTTFSLADDDFGDDSGQFANDDECDDPRFGGLLDSHLGRDATDCRSGIGGEVAVPNEPGTVLRSTGTGFFVSARGHILTNYRVVNGCSRLVMRMLGEAPIDAQLIATNDEVDLALLKVDSSPAEWAVFREGRAVRQGEEIVVYGFPLTNLLSKQGNLTAGLVTALSGGPNDLTQIQISAQIGPGNSGGPVMDRSGNVIGIIVSTLTTAGIVEDAGGVLPQNLNFAVRDSVVGSFLDINTVDYFTAVSSAEESIADIGERARQFTGMIECYQ